MSQPAFPPARLTQAPAARLAYLKTCTIAHPRLQEVDQALREAISEPTGALLIFFYGPTGVGKTTVLQRRRQQIIAERRTEMDRDPGWVPIVGVEAIAPERGDFNWRDYYLDALRAFDEPLIDRKISNPEPPAGRGSPAQSIPRRIDSRSVLRVALESAIRQRRPLAFLVDEAPQLTKIAGGRKLQDQLACLTSLASRPQTVHVLAGPYDLLILRQLSGQVSRRTRPIHFARYRADAAEDVRDFKNVLRNFQIRLPLAAEPELLRHWAFCYERSLGGVGLLQEWLTRALATGLTQKTPQLTLRHLAQQALALADCQKIATEVLEGEAILAEAEGARKQWRTLRAFADAPSRGARPAGAAPTTSPPRQHTPRVGERTPTRAPVGVGHRMSEEHTP